MRRAAVLIAALGLFASAATAQPWPGAPPISAETAAALRKAGEGSTAELTRLADLGRDDAQVFAGTFLIFGARGYPKDGARGCAYLAKASASRSDAMHLLGECHQYGYGGQKDAEQAIAAFRMAGAMGSAKSLCAEGNMLIAQGRDTVRAVELCHRGATAGDRDAQTDLANFYLQGRIVARDMAIARRWYEKAAAQGQANAALVLGQIYWNADGVPRDVGRAVALWQVAYEGGREDAAFHLGNAAFLEAGRGTGRWDQAGLAKARDWYAKAVDARNPEVASQARERRELADQLIGVMQRQKK